MSKNRKKRQAANIADTPAPAVQQDASGQRLSRTLSLVFLLVLLAPWILFIFNSGFRAFSIDRSDYFHMHAVNRLVEGGPFYIDHEEHPGQGSMVKPPIYHAVTALACRLFGTSLVTARMVTLISSLIFAVICGWIVQKRTGNRLLAFAAACFLLGSYGLAKGWLKVNVDGLMCALAAAGFALLLHDLKPWRCVLSALLLSVATLTKQTALAMLVAAGLMVFFRNRKISLVFWGSAAGALVLGVWILNLTSDGMFWANCISGAGAAPWQGRRIWEEVAPELLQRYGWLAAIGVLPFITPSTWREKWQRVLQPEYVFCAAGLAVAFVAWPKYGSGSQQGLLALGGLSICGCIGLHHLGKLLPDPANHRMQAAFIMVQSLLLASLSASYVRIRSVDEYDEMHYAKISRIFRAGRTCYFQYPFIPVLFGQPDTGNFGSEKDEWKDGKRDQSRLSAKLARPFTEQVFDYVIVPAYMSREHTSVKAALENYDVIDMIQRHPNGPDGGSTRWGDYILRAKRLSPATR